MEYKQKINAVNAKFGLSIIIKSLKESYSRILRNPLRMTITI